VTIPVYTPQPPGSCPEAVQHSRKRSRVLLACAVALGLGLAGGGALAAAWVLGGPLLRMRIHTIASGLFARAVDVSLSAYDPFGVGPSPSCNCSSDWKYRCGDPLSTYSQKVQRDPRLAALFEEPLHRIETYARYQNFLRDQFTHGEPSNPAARTWDGYNVLEMLDDAATGSRFLCGDISKMFVELVQAAGGFARMVSLVDPEGSGHVVAEAWVEGANKWILFDPDYNVYYTDHTGMPLSVLDLHKIHRSGLYDRAVAHAGASKHSEYRPARHEYLLRHYDSIAFNRRADFADTTYPYWHPDRHAVKNLSAWEMGRAAFSIVAVRDTTSDESELYFTPCRTDRLVSRARNGMGEIETAGQTTRPAREVPMLMDATAIAVASAARHSSRDSDGVEAVRPAARD